MVQCWHEKNYQQLAARHGSEYVRHLLAGVRAGQISTGDVAEALEVSQRWIEKLFGKYVEACAQGTGEHWTLCRSGGRHHKDPPEEVEKLWRKLLGSKPPLSYSFTASETLRRHGLSVDRATIRRWALRNDIAQSNVLKREPANIRRWQCESVGALWQLDVTSADPTASPPMASSVGLEQAFFAIRPDRNVIDRAGIFHSELSSHASTLHVIV